MDKLSKIFPSPDAIRLEVALRIGLTCTISIILAVAHLPKIIPPSEALVVGIVGVALSSAFPFMLFSIGASKYSNSNSDLTFHSKDYPSHIMLITQLYSFS
jgi:hypothetical protein